MDKQSSSADSYGEFKARVIDAPRREFLAELRSALEAFVRPFLKTPEQWGDQHSEPYSAIRLTFTYDFRDGDGTVGYVVDYDPERQDVTDALESLDYVDSQLSHNELMSFENRSYMLGRAVSQVDDQDFREKAAELDRRTSKESQGRPRTLDSSQIDLARAEYESILESGVKNMTPALKELRVTMQQKHGILRSTDTYKRALGLKKSKTPSASKK